MEENLYLIYANEGQSLTCPASFFCFLSSLSLFVSVFLFCFFFFSCGFSPRRSFVFSLFLFFLPSSIIHPPSVAARTTCAHRAYLHLQSLHTTERAGAGPGRKEGGGWGRNTNTIFTITILNLYFLAASFPLFLVCFVWVERRWYILLWVGLMWTNRRTKGRDS